MNGRTHRFRVLAGIAAACVAVSSVGPSFAQTAPTLGSWLSGPDGQGPRTIVGRIEAPRGGQSINAASNLLVTGWAADTTATGWAGIDGAEVWNGAKDNSSSTKLASAIVGQARPDVGDAIGSTFVNSGFSAVIPSSALQALTGSPTLYVYLHTPGKGTWYKSVGVSFAAASTLPYPNDPVIVISRPQDGMNITQKQVTNKFSFNGYALDRNPITNPATQTLGPGCPGCTLFNTGARGAGVGSVTLYMDSPKGDPIFPNFGAACSTACLGTQVLVANKGSLNVPGKPQASIQSGSYGSQYNYSGWSVPINPTLLAPGPHTLYVTATSSITGQQSTASVNFMVLDFSHQRIQP